MKRAIIFPALIFCFVTTCPAPIHADGRPGAVQWSDGHNISGALSLTPGKQLLLFTATGPVTLSLDQVQSLRFIPEKEEMRQGFYFPNAGQATQAKTGDIYPVRYLQTEITLAGGKILKGHLFTTTLYLETDDSARKIVLLAKQTGIDNQKLADLVYPTLIQFQTAAAAVSSIDLSGEHLSNPGQPIALSRPDLGLLPLLPAGTPLRWTVPLADPSKILLFISASDGLHVGWPDSQLDPAILPALQTGLHDLQDFYDTRNLLGAFTDGDDIYSLVLMKRLGASYGYTSDVIPWSLVVLRWKYDPDAKKVTLLNRANFVTGRARGNSPIPTVLKSSAFLRDITAVPSPPNNPASP